MNTTQGQGPTDTNAATLAAERQYADRDHMELGDYYVRHVSAMTGEALHSKSEIAAELAWRDREIDRLRAALASAPAC